MNVRNVTFNTAYDVVDLPDKVISSTKEIVDVVPATMNNFLKLINNVTNINSTLDTIFVHINKVKANITGITPHLDANYVAFQNVKEIYLRMANRTAGANSTLGNIDFASFDSAFGNSTTTIGSGINTALNTFETAINSSTGQISSVLGGVNGHISSLNSTVISTLNNMVSKVETFMDLGKSYYSKYFSKEIIEQVKTYSLIGEIVFAVIVVLILSFVLILMTFGFLCIFLRCCLFIKALDCCACFCIIIYGIVGAICLFVWFLTSDVCTQAEGYVVKNEQYFNPTPYQFNTPLNRTISINVSDALLGVLKCENSNYLNASGLSLQSFDIPGFIGQYEGQFTNALNNFNISSFLGSALGNINSFSGNLNISGQISTMVDNLKSTINSTLSTFYSAYPLELTFHDFEQYNATLAILNGLLTSKSLSTVNTGSEILDLAPNYYNTPTPTGGKILSNGPGANFNTIVGAGFTPSELNQIYGSLARDNSNTQFATGSVEKGLVFNLSKMNAPNPINAMETYLDFKDLLLKLDELVASVQSTENYSKNILNFNTTVLAIVDTVNNTFNGAIDSVKEFIYNSIDSLTNKVDGLDILKCDNVGNVYRTYRTSLCSNLYVAIGGTAVTNLVMVVVLFLVFILLMHADILSLRKKSQTGELDDDEDDFDGKIEDMDKQVNELRSSRSEPLQPSLQHQPSYPVMYTVYQPMANIKT